jgi:RNA polymerase sigma factor for flagellar operon FliA
LEALSDATTKAEPVAPDAAEAALWNALKAGNHQDARERLFSAHMPLARSIARRRFMKRTGGDIELPDLEQLAYSGLLEAIDRYDPARGVPFRHYAGRRISGSILDGIAKASELREQISYRNRMRRQRVRSLAPDDAASFSADDALQALIDLATGLAVGFMLDDAPGLFVDEDRDRTPSDAYESVAWRETVRRLMTELGQVPPRERAILRRHYFDGLTFDQIGALLGISKARVSQLHRAAVEGLRKRLRDYAPFRLER